MWSPDRLSRRGVLRLAAALAAPAALAGPLAGCGFRPMLAEEAGGDRLRGRVSVDAPTGRNGYALRDALERRFGRPAGAAEWALQASLRYDSEGLAITTDSSITRYVLRGTSDWVLTGPDGQVAFQGTVESMSAYSADASLYASRSAQRDAERRVAEDLGERIALRIQAAIASGEGPAALGG